MGLLMRFPLIMSLIFPQVPVDFNRHAGVKGVLLQKDNRGGGGLMAGAKYCNIFATGRGRVHDDGAATSM